jgi:hypothetical protein
MAPERRSNVKLLGIAVATVVLLAGCAVANSRPASGPVPLAYGTASSFTPLVAAPSSTPSCVRASDAPLDPGSRAVALLYPPAPERQVTVTVNSAGEPIKYLDVRGDLSESDDEMADRTTIGLYLEQGYAVLSNREGPGPPDMLEVPLDDVLTSSRFGNPSEVMEQVLATCAGAI